MIIYTITTDKDKKFYARITAGEVEIESSNEDSMVDYKYFRSIYDVEMTSCEADYYKVHYSIWKHFIENTYQDLCMIHEESVKLLVDQTTLNDLSDQLAEDVDLFLPYDRFNLEEKDKVPEICTSKLGYFVGSPVYFLSRAGALKMLGHPTIQEPLDETILTLSSTGELIVDYKELNIFTYDYRNSLSYLSRQQALKTAIFTSRWTDQHKGMARKLISYLADYCARLEIDFVLHAGSLVGAIRHGGIMPWDDDVDFAILHEMVPKLIDLINKEGVLCIESRTFESTNSTFFKCWLKNEGELVSGYTHRFPFVDLWLFYDKIEEGYILHKEGHRYPKNICMPFKDVFFEGSHVKMPNDPLATLDLQYPGWRDRIIVYPISHRYKKNLPAVLSLPIRVNDEGAYVRDV